MLETERARRASSRKHFAEPIDRLSPEHPLLQVRILFNDTAAEPGLPFAELIEEATRLVVSYLMPCDD